MKKCSVRNNSGDEKFFNGSKKNMKNKYWKLSVLKGDKYFVKVVCIPSEEDAIILANTLISKGMIVRISKQI